MDRHVSQQSAFISVPFFSVDKLCAELSTMTEATGSTHLGLYRESDMLGAVGSRPFSLSYGSLLTT